MRTMQWLVGLALLGIVAAPAASAQSSWVVKPGGAPLSPRIEARQLDRVGPSPTGFASPPRPASSIYEWFADAEFPPEALKQRREGSQQVSLTIDATGTITGCTLDAASGYAPFDTLICQLLRKRARFWPAQDDGAQPVPGKARLEIEYLLAPRRPVPVPIS